MYLVGIDKAMEDECTTKLLLYAANTHAWPITYKEACSIKLDSQSQGVCKIDLCHGL